MKKTHIMRKRILMDEYYEKENEKVYLYRKFPELNKEWEKIETPFKEIPFTTLNINNLDNILKKNNIKLEKYIQTPFPNYLYRVKGKK